MLSEDERFMTAALREAERALDLQEVPVGCVIVQEGHIIGKGHNQRETIQDPTAHAEILAITAAAAHVGSWRLENTTLYVTLEPCPMCAGAIIMSRIPRVIFAAHDPKAGVCGSLMDLLSDTRFNHQPEVVSGVLGDASSQLLKGFFQAVRLQKRRYP